MSECKFAIGSLVRRKAPEHLPLWANMSYFKAIRSTTKDSSVWTIDDNFICFPLDTIFMVVDIMEEFKEHPLILLADECTIIISETYLVAVETAVETEHLS